MESVGEFEYNTKDLIGHGAFAVVFKGRHKQKHDFTVAIKSISKKSLARSQNLLGKEIKILKELTERNHENVVALLDCKETTHHFYLVMEYCNGGDLADYLHVKGTLSEDTIRFFLRQIAAAMKALNRKGIVHRDLKPQNILLCHSGKSNASPASIKLKIADFGFARFLQEGVMAVTLCGSPMYMAPEVIMSLQYDAKADLWSIGTIVFQCLTGKAPFQAQTPHALKQFYEKNANLTPRIPHGTSSDLTDLLLRLLKRNSKDRLEFDEFFEHPFLKPVTRQSSPVPVPGRHSISPTSPLASPLTCITPPYGSPLSGNLGSSPQGWGRDGGEEMAQEPTSVTKEDFVMIPESLSDESCDKGNTPKWQQNEMHGSISRTLTTVSVSPKSESSMDIKSKAYMTPEQKQSPGGSPRPNFLPTASPGGSPTVPHSEPIPVPSQKEAYQQIQRSLQDSASSSPRSIGEKPHSIPDNPSPMSSPGTPKLPFPHSEPVTVCKDSSSSQSTDSSMKIADISSLSPPSVQFTTGTPPLGSRRRSISGGTPPLSNRRTPSVSLRQSVTPPPTSLSASPIRRSGMAGPPVSNYLPTGTTNPLSPILASPAGLDQPTMDIRNRIQPITTKDIEPYRNVNTSSPLHIAFGNRTMTLPDINTKDFWQGNNTRESLDYSNNSMQRSGSAGRLIDPMSWRGSHTLGAVSQSPPTSIMPYNHYHHPQCRLTGPISPHNSPGKVRRSSTSSGKLFSDSSSPTGTSFLPFGTSPPNMEGPILFTAPELPEETLLQREHNETLAKLNFILALVECILELARLKSTPTAALTDSYTNEPSVEQLSFVSEGYRRAEQLVLYMRALQLLSSSLQLSRQEVQAGRLQASSSVRTVLHSMKESFHYCLNMCKSLSNSGILHSTGVDPNSSTITADRLIYNYAIEMCQSAALQELIGNPHECFRRYQTAQILLHSLAQQINSEEDRKLLIKYKDAVEKRLLVLHSQGYIFAYDT